MRKIFYFVTALLIVSASCNQKPKVTQEKENVVPDSIRLIKARETMESFIESIMNAQGKFTNKDYKGAIDGYTKTIENYPGLGNSFNIYILRGAAKDSLKDHRGAIDDYTKAIEVSPIDGDPYLKRALSKRLLKDYEGAIADFTKCLEFGPNNMWSYYYRGLVKIESGDNKGGCRDLKKAADFNNPNAKEAIKKYCQ